MGAPRASDIFHFVHVLSTEVSEKAKAILATVGSNVGEGLQMSSNLKWLQHVGFASRPPKTVIGKDSASTLVMRLGNQEVAVASFDERGLSLYGDLDHGETCIYAPGVDGKGQGRILLKKDGSVNIYSRAGNADGGAGMLIQLDAANDTIRLLNSKGNGIIIDPDGVKLTAGGSGSSLTLNSSGTCALVATKQCQVDGATVLLGSIAAPVVNAVCVGPCGLVAVASSKVLCALA